MPLLDKITAAVSSVACMSRRFFAHLCSLLAGALLDLMGRLRRSSWVAFFWIMGAVWLSAHPADVGYLRVKVQRDRLELRLTFNLALLGRMVTLDRDGNQQLNAAELATAEPELRRYWQEKLLLRLNEQPGSLGMEMRVEPVWPEAKNGWSVPTRDFPMRHLDLIFTPVVPSPLASIGLDLGIWTETGPLSSVEATYEQDDLLTQVLFSAAEPDYLYDTGYAVESIFTKPKAADPRPRPFGIGTWVGIGVGLILLLVGGLWLKKQR